MRTKISFSSIEALEARIAPAGMVVFGEQDGDVVKVFSSQGTDAELRNALTVVKGQIQKLDLTGGPFSGADISLSVETVGAAGDGLANLGFLKATGRSLGNVSIDGDLTKISVGSEAAKPALNSLTVVSLGLQGTSTGAPDRESTINGGIGKLTIARSVEGAHLRIGGQVGSVAIGGLLQGANADHSGEIEFFGSSVGSVTVEGLSGGSGDDSGRLEFSPTTKVGTITVKDGLQGNAGAESGSISGGSMASISIGGDILGGTGERTGTVRAAKIGNVTVGGKIEGGSKTESGRVQVDGNAGVVKVHGGIEGGTGSNSGQLQILGKAKSITILGDIHGGGGMSSGALFGAQAGPVVIDGELIGGSGVFAGRINFIGDVGKFQLDGSIEGGTGVNSGRINFLADTGAIAIQGDLRGGGGSASGTIELEIAGKTKSLKIGGSVLGGAGVESGSISTIHEIGTFRVEGDVLGGKGEDAGSVALGSVRSAFIDGSLVGSTGKDSGVLALTAAGSITIGGMVSGVVSAASGQIIVSENVDSLLISGSVANASLRIGGVDSPLNETTAKAVHVGGDVTHSNIAIGDYRRADVSAGSLIVDGTWTCSNLVVGTQNLGTNDAVGGIGTAADDKNFGDAHDAYATTKLAKITSKIASIVIGGGISGSASSTTDHFGFVAGQIGKFRVAGQTLPLHAGGGNDDLTLGAGGDTTIHELGR